MERDITQMRMQLDSISAERNKRPEMNYEELDQQFLENPARTNAEISRRIIQDELGETAQTLQNMYAMMQKQQRELNAQQVYSQFSNLPHWDRVGDTVKQLVSQHNLEPTNDNISNIYKMAIGHLVMSGQIQPTATTNTPKPPMNRPNIPAQLSPSAPPMPSSRSAEPIQLTELEKRIARENRMTPEEYMHWMRMDSQEVLTASKSVGN